MSPAEHVLNPGNVQGATGGPRLIKIRQREAPFTSLLHRCIRMSAMAEVASARNGMSISMAPQPRFRFYNGLRNYRLAASDLALGRVFKGDAVSEAEKAVSHWLNVPEAVLAPQGRYAIYLGLRQFIRPGQNVVMSPYTLYDVVNMVVAAGAQPRFADIDEDTCNLSPSAAAEAIDKDTAAVLVTHLHGHLSRIDEFESLSRDTGIPLLEDACQAFGACWQGRRAGTIGNMGFFSFGRAKNVNAFLGGMIVTADTVRAAKLRFELERYPREDIRRLSRRIGHCFLGEALTWQPIFSAFTYRLFQDGVLNSRRTMTRQFDTEANPVLRRTVPPHYEKRISDMQARLVLDQLARVDEMSRTRIETAEIYDAGLRDIPDIVLPPLKKDLSHIYLSYPIQVGDRTALQRYMMQKERDVVIQHLGNTADYACFAEFRRECPQARKTADRVLLLPTYPSYAREQAQKNVEVIRDFYS
jgi:perosamine synthetase